MPNDCPGSPGRALRILHHTLLPAAMALGLVSVHAQQAPPEPSASMPAQAAPEAVPATSAPVAPVDPVRLFIDACLLAASGPAEAVDRGLQAGLFPYPGDAPQAAPLLDGRPGTVMSLAGPAGDPPPIVMLAVVPGGHCTVWAEGLHGPSLHQDLILAVEALRQQEGVSVQPLSERTVERAGAWRRQVQWRFRLAPGQPELGFGTVTTLGDAPGAQVLRLAWTTP